MKSGMKAGIYARKSKETEKGESVSNQIKRGKAFCEIRGWDYEIYKDTDYSGKNLSRPDFERMYKDIESGKIHTVISYKLDRVSRSVNDFSSLITDLSNRGVDFVSLTENFDTTNPLGRAMMYISSVFAQLERETIAERVKDNMHDLFATGRYVGGKIMLGYDLEKTVIEGKTLTKLVVNKEESEIIRFIFESYLNDGASTITIARELMQRGTKSKNGVNISNTAIARILSSLMYVQADELIYDYFSDKYLIVGDSSRFDGTHGCQTYGKSMVTSTTRKKNDKTEWKLTAGSHDWIISSSTFIAVQEKLVKQRRLPPRRGTSANSVLTGLVKCGVCGASMCLRKSTAKDAVYKYMYCPTKTRYSLDSCSQGNIGAGELETKVINLILELSQDKDKFKKGLNDKLAAFSSKKEPVRSAREAALTNLAQIDSDIKRVLDLLVREVISDQEYRIKVDDLKIQKNELEKFIASSKDNLDNINYDELNIEHIFDMLDKMANLNNITDFKERRALIRSVVKEIIINGDQAEVVLFFDAEEPFENGMFDRLSISSLPHR